MEEKLKEIIQFFGELSSQEDLSFEREILDGILYALDHTGVKVLVMLEKPGKDIDMLTNGISGEAVSALVTILFADSPELRQKVIEKMGIMKTIQAQKDKENTPLQEAAIH